MHRRRLRSRPERLRRDPKQAEEDINSKHEIRNSKQIQMTKRTENSKQASFGDLVPIWTFDISLASPFVSDFDIRISDFPGGLPPLWARNLGN
jgi:hypothetical protein